MYLITDYIDDPDIERSILGEPVSQDQKYQANVLLVWHERIDESYVAKFDKLQGVVRYGVGYDNIDLEVLSKRAIVFCNTPDYGVDEVSDTAVGMILNISRGISVYDRKSRLLTGQRWQEERISSLTRNSDQIIGVIGAGRGWAAERKALGLPLDVTGNA